jgi:hypothetical protein
VNTALGANERPQNVVVVSLEPVPLPHADADADADADARAIFEHLRADLVKMLDAKGLRMDLTTTAGTVCGLPAETITFAGADAGLGAMTAPQGRPATMLHVVTKVGGDTYLVAVSQTIEPDNPTYQRDGETILTGFQVLPPMANL